jgi:transcriptional regulator with XRE-family HTH domain
MNSSYRLEAKVLRRRGYSFSQLAERIGISKSTASLWTRDVVLSPLGIYRLKMRSVIGLERSNVSMHRKKIGRLEAAEEQANSILDLPRGDEIREKMIALSIMYWCEGVKNDRVVQFVNSDPYLCRSFIDLLEDVLYVDRLKIRLTLHLHDYHDECSMKTFWSQSLDIPEDQFTKTYIKASHHINKRDGYKGCIRISYYDCHVARVLIAFAKKTIRLYSNTDSQMR